ncbi:MAG TPA: phosphate ABC transporter substrate-binding protein [Clostridia bacterium]|nr:phosphate ABC transporter substrate-binding protein [Clostridia bacterium]
MNKRKLIALGITVVLALGIFAGCAKDEEEATGTEGALSGTVSVVGSTSVAPHAQKLADAFMAKNPGTKIDVQGVGSTAGVKAANEGAADIGMASRNLKTEEKEWGLDEHVIAYDGISVVVNPENGVSDMSIETVTAIFKGEITNWKEVGGIDKEILVVSREAGSGTRGAFEDIMDLEEKNAEGKKVSAVKADALIAEGNGAVKANVASKTYAIGYISLSYIDESVQPVSIGGVEATVENILDESYTVSRPFLMLSKGELTDVAKAYLDFVFSTEGQEIVAEKAIPVK